jgi:hypothetical protein
MVWYAAYQSEGMTVTLPFTEAAVGEVAALLGVPARPEPYAVRGAAVYRLEVPNASLGVVVTLLLWPSLGRVDVRIGDCSMVYKGVATVELITGVEAIFRRGDGDGYLFVSVGGRASIVV